jgi:hypothetical protein
MAMRVQARILFDGYVEENTMAGMPIFHEQGFDSVEEALASFAGAIVASDAEEQRYRQRQCCKDALATYPGYKCCPECGSPLKSQGLDTDEGCHLMYQISRGTTDSTARAYDHIVEAGWKYGAWALPEVLGADVIVTVHSYASDLLWFAHKGELCYPNREQSNFRAELGEHCDVGLRKGLKDDGVRLYVKWG